MKKKIQLFSLFLLLLTLSCEKTDDDKNSTNEDNTEVLIEKNTTDMLTPSYYTSEDNSDFVKEVNTFLEVVRKETYHHPLENELEEIPDYLIPESGSFGAGKGFNDASEHHAAVDLHVGNNQTKVNIYAAHDGMATTFKDAEKYRHYIAITKNIIENNITIGKLVSIYAHVDLDLDEAESISINNTEVKKGDLISKNLYSETVGGPHLHFEIRYYRATDLGTETFYSFTTSELEGLSEESAGQWTYGIWNPSVGYGFANPISLVSNF